MRNVLGEPRELVEQKYGAGIGGGVEKFLLERSIRLTHCWQSPWDVRELAQRVEATESIQCPFCGQSFDLVIDTSIGTQRFTTDCEVCCRPFEVFAECEPGEVLSIEVQGQ